ncbi:MAG TPA: Crp/Fnr family transcriptional regulator [Candidatus Binatia bacterium]|jgi:CRP-like cAMP-binding protein
MRRISCEQCPVRGSSVCGGLPLSLLDEFRACTTTAIYKPRQALFFEGAPATGLYLVCHGAVKVYQSDRFGRDYIAGIAHPGDVLGEIGTEEGTTCSTSAEATVETQATFLSREHLARFLQLHPSAGLRLVTALCAALAGARRKTRDFAFKSAEGRLAELVLRLTERATTRASQGAAHFTLAYSRREIAEMIGVSPETAIRLFGGLRDRHLLSLEARELTIHDPERLRRIAHHCDVEG